MIKRLFDIAFSGLVLVLTAPILLTALAAVWLYDRHSPFYHAKRAGRGSVPFTMLKIRSMRVDADKLGGSSTAATDRRITPVGHYIRRFKIDELSQFWNVLKGDMSVVGPRPNTVHEAAAYTPAEKHLLDVKPGITDLSSIVFSDEGAILAGAPDPDGLYDRIIRPWKSRLGLLYIDHSSLALDLRIVWLTAVAIVSKRRALDGVAAILEKLDADPQLRAIARRADPLPEGLPPGLAAS